MRQVWKLMKSAPGELVCSVFYCIQFIPPIPYSCSKTLYFEIVISHIFRMFLFDIVPPSVLNHRLPPNV